LWEGLYSTLNALACVQMEYHVLRLLFPTTLPHSGSTFCLTYETGYSSHSEPAIVVILEPAIVFILEQATLNAMTFGQFFEYVIQTVYIEKVTE
jgi:hypothetical protein